MSPRPGKKPAEPEAAALDAQVLAQLEKAGSDLSRPHHVDNFLYFRDEETAEQAAHRLRPLSQTVEISPAAKGSTWLARAAVEVVPSPANIAAMRSQMEGVASELRGDYDGWGAEIVPTEP